jgi:hypothetical protein
MNADEIYAITKRAPGRWRVWTACFLMAFDVFVLPAWLMTVAAELAGYHGEIDINGQVVPLWFVLGQGVMAILSVVAIGAIALQTNALGFRVVVAVAVGWVVFLTVAWLAGAWSAWAVAGRLVILGLLVWGRGPFLPQPASGAATLAPTA